MCHKIIVAMPSEWGENLIGILPLECHGDVRTKCGNIFQNM